MRLAPHDAPDFLTLAAERLRRARQVELEGFITGLLAEPT